MTVSYYIGDLCYVMHDVWQEVCSLLSYDNETWEFSLQDGRKFFLFNTAYGDGLYHDQNGGEYPVDSGTIGAILVSDIQDNTYPDLTKVGCIHEFQEQLQEYDCGYENGDIIFGSVVIETDV